MRIAAPSNIDCDEHCRGYNILEYARFFSWELVYIESTENNAIASVRINTDFESEYLQINNMQFSGGAHTADNSIKLGTVSGITINSILQQTFTYLGSDWDNGIGGDWFDGRSWDIGCVPGPNDIVIIDCADVDTLKINAKFAFCRDLNFITATSENKIVVTGDECQKLRIYGSAELTADLNKGSLHFK